MRLKIKRTMNRKNYSQLIGAKFLLALSLIIISLLTTKVQAQKSPINRTIVGCTIGASTPAQVKAIIQKQGGRIISITHPEQHETTYRVIGLKYAGFKTMHTEFTFHKNRLLTIALVFDNLSSGRTIVGDTLVNVTTAIEYKLIEKYGELPVASSDSTKKDKFGTEETTTTINKIIGDSSTLLCLSTTTTIYGLIIPHDIGVLIYADRPKHFHSDKSKEIDNNI